MCIYHATYAFRVNVHAVVACMSRDSLLETDAIFESYVTARRLEPATTEFANEHSTIYPDWAVWLNG